MSEIMRRNAPPLVSRRSRQIVASASEATLAEQAAMRAVSATAEYAMSEVLFLKQTQAELERLAPDAAGALALIADSATFAIAAQVRRFGERMSR